ncbi:MAG: hypothetical protein ACQESX_01325 [Bacteroidota bacterium]
MYIRFILLFCLLISTAITYGQENSDYESDAPVFTDIISSGKVRSSFTIISDPFKEKLKKYDGTPYMDEDFKPAEIKVKFKNEPARNLKMRYNVYAQQFEIKSDEQLYGMTKTEKVDYVKMGSRKFIFAKENNNLQVFEQLTQDGHARLLIKHKCMFKPSNYNAALDAGNRNPYFYHDNDYYLQLGEEEPFEIKRRRKKVISALNSKQDEIKNYFKSNNLSAKSENDLIKVIHYYNDIL